MYFIKNLKMLLGLGGRTETTNDELISFGDRDRDSFLRWPGLRLLATKMWLGRVIVVVGVGQGDDDTRTRGGSSSGLIVCLKNNRTTISEV